MLHGVDERACLSSENTWFLCNTAVAWHRINSHQRLSLWWFYGNVTFCSYPTLYTCLGSMFISKRLCHITESSEAQGTQWQILLIKHPANPEECTCSSPSHADWCCFLVSWKLHVMWIGGSRGRNSEGMWPQRPEGQHLGPTAGMYECRPLGSWTFS